MTSFTVVVLLFLSGVAGLGYQLVWTRMFTVGLGHEFTSMIAVIAAFFGGLALGAFTLDKWVSNHRRPARCYALLETAIALWALISAVSIETVNDQARLLMGLDPDSLRFWSIAFLLPFLSLLPATIAMGATLPAADRWLANIKANSHQTSLAYSANTGGAVLGVLTVSYWLMPLLGFRATLLALASINASVAVGAYLIEHRRNEAPAPQKEISHPTCSHSQPILLWSLLITGFLGIAYEIITVRVMSQVLEGAIYSYAAVLVVYLTGAAIGAAWHHRHGRSYAFRPLFAGLAFALSLACLLGLNTLYGSHTLYWSIRKVLNDTLLSVMFAELTVAASVLFLPALLMGALFCHLATQARHRQGGVGWALGVNLGGGLLAPLIAGAILIPLSGPGWSLILIAFSYVILALKIAGLPRWAFGIPILLAVITPTNLQIVTLREGESLFHYQDGATASLAVVERNEERNLRVNNRFQMGGTGVRALRLQRMQAHVPLLLHHNPERVLFLGVASGITASAALAHDAIQIDAVELVPESLELLPYFAPYNQNLQASDRVRLYASDARRFVRAATQPYDVIIGDLFHPGRDGGGMLYTLEHFKAIDRRLKTDGIYCQWLPLYQMDETMLRSIIATFQNVFTTTEAWLAGFDLSYPSLALIAYKGSANTTEVIESAMRLSESLRQQLHSAAIRNAVQFAGHYLADHQTLAAFAGNAALNTDDKPLVLFDAPRFTVKRDIPSFATFETLLKNLSSNANDRPPMLGAHTQSEFIDRWQAFLKARNIYFDTLIRHPDSEHEAVNGYMAAAKSSADFTLAYAQVVSIALDRATRDPSAARALLEQLNIMRPEYTAARDILRRLPIH